jgi:hypothetical protein
VSRALNLGVFWGWIVAINLAKPPYLQFWLPELDLNQQPCD